jgi:opacity protein-like surface antigen
VALAPQTYARPLRRAFPNTSFLYLTVSLVLLASGAAAAHAQVPAAGHRATPSVAPDTGRAFALYGRASFTGVLVVPTDERGDLSGGFQIGAGLGWGKIPLLLGVDFGFSAGGQERYLSRVEDFPDLRVEVTRQDKFYFITGWLRLQPLQWPYVQPYVESFAGTKLLQTEYGVALVEGEGATLQTEERDWTRSLGWGAGLDLPVSKAATVFVTLGLRRLYSPDAVFTDTVRSGAGETTRATVRVPMDSWLVSVGFAGSF